MRQECFCKGEHGGPIVGLYSGKPICQRHASFLKPGEVQPLPMDSDRVASKIQVLQAVVPSGEYEQAQSLLDAGKLEAALSTAYAAAAKGLIGAIRGRVLRVIWTSDALTTQALTATFLRRVETLLESKNPQAAFDAAFDLLDTINVQMEVVVEAATLVQYGLSLEERAKSLPFTGDALEGLMVQRLKLRGIIEKPDSRVSEDLRPIEAELLELDRLIQSTQDVKSQSVERENRGPKRGKRQRKTERREYDRDWRSRLPRIDEDELPDNVRLLRVCLP